MLFPSLCWHIAMLLITTRFLVQAAERVDTILSNDWRFEKGDVASAEKPGFDASGWQTVSIPHCWGWQEAQKGDVHYYRGPGWYRRELDITPEKGRRYFLRFEAASLTADVYLNGRQLGEHRGGFGAFCYEITRELSSGGTNILVVRHPEIATLLDEGAQDGQVHLERLAADRIAQSQRGGLQHRREGLAYRLAMAQRDGRWVPARRVAPSLDIPPRRKRIYRVRLALADESHTAFAAARAAGDLSQFFVRMAPLIKRYQALYRPPILHRLRQRLARLLNKMRRRD
jgi:hypothetical protein